MVRVNMARSICLGYHLQSSLSPLLLYLLVETVIGAQASIIPSSNDQSWEAWKTRHGKSYASSEEDIRRRQLWTKEVELVAKHNKAFEEGRASYSQEVYGWVADDEEENDWKCVSSRASHHSFSATSNFTSILWNRNRPTISANVPGEVDYREQGYVTSVNEQGKCGACWAFAVMGAIEAWRAKSSGVLEKLSAQQLLDCNESGGDCSGGFTDNAMEYAIEYGLQRETQYPYVEEKQACKYDCSKVVFKLDNFDLSNYLPEPELKLVVGRFGPTVSNMIITRSYKRYQGGIYSNDDCNRPGLELNHSVLLIGYGKSDGASGDKEYWLIKDSMGPEWGEQGFSRLQRNIGLCSIGSEVVWPT